MKLKNLLTYGLRGLVYAIIQILIMIPVYLVFFVLGFLAVATKSIIALLFILGIILIYIPMSFVISGFVMTWVCKKIGRTR